MIPIIKRKKERVIIPRKRKEETAWDKLSNNVKLIQNAIMSPLRIMWKDDRKTSSNNSILRDVELLKKHTANDIKNKFELSNSKSRLLDRMIHDYKTEIPMADLSTETKALGYLDRERLSEMLQTHFKHWRKTRFVSLTRTNLNGISPYDVKLMYYLHGLRNGNKNTKLSLTKSAKKSKLERQEMLFKLLEEYEEAEKKRKKNNIPEALKIKNVPSIIKNVKGKLTVGSS